MVGKTKCRGCGRQISTWAEQRKQFGRAIKRGLNYEQAKEASPRCQKCMTNYLAMVL